MIEAEAPGKLVLAGEYAVLEGSPGLAVAVGIRARATIEPIPSGSRLLVPGERDGEFPFRWLAGAPPRWEEERPGDYALPVETLAAALADGGLWPRHAELPPCRITLDTRAFREGDAHGRAVKLGLGSSAAVLVALAGALAGHARLPEGTLERLLAPCLAAHRRMQGGRGSGIDVAAALRGGVVAVTFEGPGAVPAVEPLHWPAGLHVLPVWSGLPASTGTMLAALASWRDRRPTEHTAHMERLGATVARLLPCWRAADVAGVLTGLAAFDDALTRFDRDAGLGVYTPVHEALRRLSHAHGAVYKPSGAGGGDFGLAFSADEAGIGALRAELGGAGYRCLEASLAVPGLSVRHV